MQHLIVSDEQARIISQSSEGIEIRDRNGKCLGYVAHGFSDEDITIAKDRMASDEPRHTTREVLNHLRSLERE